MNFGEKLRLLRTEKGWHQPDLAEKLGIEQSYLSKLENGKSIPSAEIFDSILQAFGISVAEFMDGLEDPSVRKQLMGLPPVASYLGTQQVRQNRNQRAWLIGSGLSLCLGFGAIIAGALSLANPTIYYQYMSDGIVPRGEQGEMFTVLEEYVDYAVSQRRVELIDSGLRLDQAAMESQKDAYQISARLAGLQFDHYLSSRFFRGQFFTVEMNSKEAWDAMVAAGVESGGTRTYHLNSTTEIKSQNYIYYLVIGVMLFVGGFAGFAVERRMHQRGI